MMNNSSDSPYCIRRIPDNFHENNDLRFHPLLITEESKDWNLLKVWNESFFEKKYGHIKVKIRQSLPYELTRKNGGVHGNSTIKEYIDYSNSNHDEFPYYLDNWQFALDCPELLGDYSVPCAFKSWHREFANDIKEELRWIFIGTKNSGSPMHIDVHLTSAWNVLVTGRKVWKFYRPRYTHHVYEGCVDAFKPDYLKHPLFKDIESITIEQKPGDIVYTPPGWWHQVQNLEKGISLTENFVNTSNWKVVYKYHELQSSVCLNSKKWADSIMNSHKNRK